MVRHRLVVVLSALTRSGDRAAADERPKRGATLPALVGAGFLIATMTLFAPSAAQAQTSVPGEYMVVSGGVPVFDVPGGRPLISIGPGKTFIVTRLSGPYAYGYPGGKQATRGWVLSESLRPLTFRRCRPTDQDEDVRVFETRCAEARAVHSAWSHSGAEGPCTVGWFCVLPVRGHQWHCTATIYARHSGHVHGRVGCYRSGQTARVRIYYIGYPV